MSNAVTYESGFFFQVHFQIVFSVRAVVLMDSVGIPITQQPLCHKITLHLTAEMKQ